MKGSKHSRQQSDSVTTARRRETQARNNIVQAHAYQQRMPNNATYYTLPTTEQDVYEAYHASTAVLPQQYNNYHQQQVDHEDLRRSVSTGDWSLQEDQSHRLLEMQRPAKQKQQQLKGADATALLDVRHRPSSGAWTMHDDHRLITARSEGLNWSQIQQQFFPSKSSNACRKRHERLIDSKGRGNDETHRMERIAAEYVQMREKLWRPLADKTGEKWTYVERQCLSNGLKNLQGVARAATRRQRFDANAMAAAAAAAAAGYDDDSGVSGIGLTPVDEVDAAGNAGPGTYSSSSPAPPSPNHAAQSFASTATQATTSTYLAHPHQLAQAHLNPAAATAAAYSSLMYGAAAAQYHHPHHAYSSSISSDGSLHPGYVSRRGNESA